MANQPSTISDIKSAFYDFQRQQANLFEALVSEVVTLNTKIKEIEVKPEETK